jgi:hypothetical protein
VLHVHEHVTRRQQREDLRVEGVLPFVRQVVDGVAGDHRVEWTVTRRGVKGLSQVAVEDADA